MPPSSAGIRRSSTLPDDGNVPASARHREVVLRSQMTLNRPSRKEKWRLRVRRSGGNPFEDVPLLHEQRGRLHDQAHARYTDAAVGVVTQTLPRGALPQVDRAARAHLAEHVRSDRRHELQRLRGPWPHVEGPPAQRCGLTVVPASRRSSPDAIGPFCSAELPEVRRTECSFTHAGRSRSVS